MKKFTVKASALAIAAALPGIAAANIDLVTGTGAATYASELVPASGAVVTAPQVQGVLGFGVSQGQDRYIRMDVSGAKWAAALAGTSLEADSGANCAAPGGANATETLVQGGQANGTNAIWQITATVAAGLTQAQPICLTTGVNGVTLTSAAGASITYSLYSDPASAAAGGSSGRLATASAPLASTKSGLVYTVTPNSSTADVTTSYKKFIVPAGATTVSATKTIVGSASVANAAGVLDLSGANVTVPQLLTSFNMVLVGADFSAIAANGVTLSSAADCVAPVANGEFLAASATTRVRAGLTGANGGTVCFTANGTSPIAAQDFTIAFDVTAAAGSTAADTTAAAVGTFDRDGTILKAPIFAGTAGQSTYVQLANVGNVAASYTTTCYAPSGATSNGAGGTVNAGNTSKLFFNNLGCGAGANAVQFTFAVPAGNVVGTLVRQSTTTGDSALDSLTGNQ